MKISLVLGSGGARGYAHIGVIHELVARGHEVVAISGASMGALVGGLFAAGKLDEYVDFVSPLTKRDVRRLVDPDFAGPGMVRLERIMGKMHEMVGDVRIEDLPIEFCAVATDISRRREVWFRRGELLPVIRASIAIPMIVTPVVLGGRLLADGGILNPLPVEPSMHLDADLTLGVALFGRAPGGFGALGEHTGGSPAKPEEVEEPEPRLLDRITEPMRLQLARLTELRPQLPREVAMSEALPVGLSSMEMLQMTLDTMQSVIQFSRLSLNQPDVLLQIPDDVCGTYDFHRADEVIAAGRRIAARELDRQGL